MPGGRTGVWEAFAEAPGIWVEAGERSAGTAWGEAG